MKRAIVITDLTRMQDGRVCIAGYDQQWRCIRPVLPSPGIVESTLYSDGQPIITQGAVVEFNLLVATPDPPHTEDHLFHPGTLNLVKRLDEERRRHVLERTCSPSVEAIFETEVCEGPGFYVMHGCGCRSLGTVQPKAVHWLRYSPDSGGKVRMEFSDHSGKTYRLAISDLTLQAYCEEQRRSGHTINDVVAALEHELTSHEIYLRIGLARGWDQFPGRCFLQITGVYTFPDYLGGRTFADLITWRPPRTSRQVQKKKRADQDQSARC